jgi:hypothetical protein
MSYTLYPIRVKVALLFRSLTYTNIAMGEDGGSTSGRVGHELGIDLMSLPFQDPNDAVMEDGDVQYSKTTHWLDAFEMSGFGLGGGVDGGNGMFGDGVGFLRADSDFVNISSPSKMEERIPQRVFELENYDGLLAFDDAILFRHGTDFEIRAYTASELHIPTILADFAL